MLQALDAAAVRRWCAAASRDLAAAREEIDGLNVYPVPDGDTGTNLLLTVQAADEAVRAAPGDLAATVNAMASGALLGARGNSGVILSQLLRGLAEGLADDGSPAALRAALARAAELAYASVARPVEGTVLTVARECAEAVAGHDGDLAAVVRAARRAAAASLARTPDLLPQLRDAGVVDAGGRGLCVLLEALERVVTGREGAGAALPPLLVPREPSGLPAAREAGADEYAYEVQYLLRDTDAAAVACLREALAGLGDSLVVVGAPEQDLWNVHVHVNDVGAALEAGLDAGRPFRVSVTRFADQAVEPRSVPGTGARSGRAVVAFAPGPGLADLFQRAGAHVVDGGAARVPSPAELLAAVRAAAAAEVVLLPNDPDVLAVAAAAAAAARHDGCAVAVVPTRSSVQGLAAVAVADRERPYEDDVAAMAEAAGSTRAGEVAVAGREAVTMAGICRPGDVLGLLEGDVVLLGADVEQVARALLERLLAGGGELVTVVAGADAPPGAAERVAADVERAHPAVDVVVYDGGQPHLLLLGVE